MKHGNLDVPRKTIIDGLDLYRWLGSQRYLGRTGKLAPERIARLNQLDFDWNADPEWEYYFQQVAALPRKNGHSVITKKSCPVGSPLPAWAEWQRKRFFHHVGPALTEDQLHKLQSIGFDFAPRSDQSIWNSTFLPVLFFYEEKHHLRIPPTGQFSSVYRKLKALWQAFQEYPKGNLSSEQYGALQGIGFTKNVTFKFLEKYQYYKEFILNFLTSSNGSQAKDIRSLRRWISREKTYRKAALLTPDESMLLDDLIYDYENSPIAAWQST